MKKITGSILSILLLIGCTTSENNNPNNDLKLWYNQPAQNWNEALPIGNGRIGAMIFGGVSQDHLQLNEETIWAGEPGNNVLPALKELLPAIRKLIFDGKNAEAQALALEALPRHAAPDNNYGMPYQTLGDLYLTFPGHESPVNYRRELDIANATATVNYDLADVNYQRTYLTSFTEDVLAIHLTATKSASISFTIGINSPHKNQQIKVGDHILQFSGVSGSADNKTGKVKFTTLVKPFIQGGVITETDSSMIVSDADEVTLFVSTGTNFKGYDDLSGDDFAKAKSLLESASSKDFHTLQAQHVEKYKQYFDRVSLDLGRTDSVKKPTDVRIQEFGKANDPQLVSLYFQFGRYLLISSSQPGGQPANLQGIWNAQLSPPWDSKYTVNINTEMNYWPAEVTNLAEMHEPLFDMLGDLSKTGQQTAREMYGARGWCMHHNTDLWRITGPVDGAFYGLWPMGGAWLSQHLWQHYLYTGDLAFLQKVYPILKGSALFYVDVLQPEPSHDWLVVVPGMSPENSYEKGVSITAGTTMDNQLVFDVFSNFMAASELLNLDLTLADSVKMKRNQLPPMQIGQLGQLQEWLQDLDREDDHHRHVSHLYGLYPSNQISPELHPELFEAAKNSLIYRGDQSTGWSMGWKVNLWARLLDGNRALKLITDQLSPAPMEGKGEKGGTYPNLLDAHPPFQIDGNFGCTSGIAEMLVQSHDGAVHLLPALPDSWPSGKVSGLKTRGGFEIVELEWENGLIKKLTVTSHLGGNLRLKVAGKLVPLGDSELKTAEGINENQYFKRALIAEPIIKPNDRLKGIVVPQTTLYDVSTAAGKTYAFGGQ